jgi:carboxypeptidase Q
MRRIFLLLCLCMSMNAFAQMDSVMLNKIFSDALANGKAYESLRELTQSIGGRLSGSPQAAAAVQWAKQKMIEAGADTVYLQEVMVPHWIRGKQETGFIIEENGNKTQVQICALGNSTATTATGITAQIIEVNDFEELRKLSKEGISGKIVFFNHAFNDCYVNTFEAYGECVKYRWAGPSEASRYGAIGTVCRSMTNAKDDFPHTGAMHYNDSLPQIPCCAISTIGADLLSRIVKANKKTKFTFTQECHFADSVLSYNVIGEIKGTDTPEKFVTVGGHLDSWDLGQGAHDDGAGVVQSIELLRLFKANNIKPKATLRIVAFMNEENGSRGGQMYAKMVGERKEKHIAAIESDGGGFTPTGFGLEMTDDQKIKIRKWTPLFQPYGIYNFTNEGDGADISPLSEYGIPTIGLYVDSQRYFDYHHTANDTFDKVNRRELLLGAAAMGGLAYLLCTYSIN